jgi:MYXO-CTERM domain-containing protein
VVAVAVDVWGNMGQSEPVILEIGYVEPAASSGGEAEDTTGMPDPGDDHDGSDTSGAPRPEDDDETSGAPVDPASDAGGCSCRAPAPADPSRGLALLVLASFVARRRRRRSISRCAG